jgi:hypothetical protein
MEEPPPKQVSQRDAAFKVQRKHLIDEITRGVAEMVELMQTLNGNLEKMHEESEELRQFNEAWHKFYCTVAAPSISSLSTNEE